MTHEIIHKPTIDKSLVRSRFERSFRRNANAAVMQPRMASHLVNLLIRETTVASNAHVLELGCGPSSFAPELLKHITVDRWTSNDLVPVQDLLRDSIQGLPINHFEFIEGDMEALDLPGNQDLIISNAAFQWLTEPRAFLSSLVEKLAPSGMLAFSTFGPENLSQIRKLTGVSLNYLPTSEYSSFFEGKGRIICLEEDLKVETFDSPDKILSHLRQTGVNALSRKTWTRTELSHFIDSYSDQFGKNGNVELTYHPVYVIFQRQAKEIT